MSHLSDREAFLSNMSYASVRRVPMHLVEPWPDTLERWRGEGLPAGVDVHAFLGVSGLKVQNVSGNTSLWPQFETCLISEDDEFIVSRDEYGRTVRNFKHRTSFPEWIDFPVKSPEDLRRFIDEHYDVSDLSQRFPPDWEDRVRQAGQSGDLILIDGGCYYWTLRSAAGVENASYLFYDAPELIDELFERINYVCLEGLKRASRIVKIDLIGYGEDIAFKTGTLISPAAFSQHILPLYRRVMDTAHSLGIEFGWMDSDGDIREIIPALLDTGINIVAPCEVAAGMSPVELRRRFGRDLRMIGGLDKRAVAEGKEAIDREFELNKAVIDEGGYLPAIDHSVSSDISFSNYAYFICRLKEVAQMPS